MYTDSKTASGGVGVKKWWQVVIIGLCTGLLTKGLMMLIDIISDVKLEILWP